MDAGFADAREEGFALAARDAGLADPARDALEAGFAAAALEAGFVATLDAGFAYARVSKRERRSTQATGTRRTFLAGGSSPLTAGAPSSASFSVAVRLRPLVDFGFSSPSAAGSFTFFERGFAGAFFGAGSGFGWSLMRAERRGSAAVSVDGAALRGMFEMCARVVGERGQGMVGEGVQDARGAGAWLSPTLLTINKSSRAQCGPVTSACLATFARSGQTQQALPQVLNLSPCRQNGH